jgi:hypothetical protein
MEQSKEIVVRLEKTLEKRNKSAKQAASDFAMQREHLQAKLEKGEKVISD